MTILTKSCQKMGLYPDFHRIFFINDKPKLLAWACLTYEERYHQNILIWFWHLIPYHLIPLAVSKIFKLWAKMSPVLPSNFRKKHMCWDLCHFIPILTNFWKNNCFFGKPSDAFLVILVANLHPKIKKWKRKRLNKLKKKHDLNASKFSKRFDLCMKFYVHSNIVGTVTIDIYTIQQYRV